MENNGKIKIKPRIPGSGLQEPNLSTPPPVPPIPEDTGRPLLRIKSKNTGYDKLLSRLSESERRNLRLRRLMIFGFPALILLALGLVFLFKPAVKSPGLNAIITDTPEPGEVPPSFVF